MENHPFLWRRIRRVRRIQVCMACKGLRPMRWERWKEVWDWGLLFFFLSFVSRKKGSNTKKLTKEEERERERERESTAIVYRICTPKAWKNLHQRYLVVSQIGVNGVNRIHHRTILIVVSYLVSFFLLSVTWLRSAFNKRCLSRLFRQVWLARQ